ncbi:hypothetical protein FS837_006361 [Tulasnella sp. UAMH 9824]|nr:hypothetical protein FS837_006361 [Tulasnella sp. UAMH 9824]
MNSDFPSPYQHQLPFNSQRISARRDEISGRVLPPFIPVSTDSGVNNSATATETPQGRPRKVTSSVSKSIKAKTVIIGTSATEKRRIIHGIDVLTLPYPLSWTDVPRLGPPLPGPDPELLSDPSYSQEAKPSVRDCVLGAIRTRKCRNPVEVTITIAEKLEWRVLKNQKQPLRPSWTQRLLSTINTVENVISRAQIPRDREGYYTITDQDKYSLPLRKFENEQNGGGSDAQPVTSTEGSETVTTPTLTLSPSSSLCPSMTGGSSPFGGVMGAPTPVFANSTASTANTKPVFYSGGNEVIQDWRNRQDVYATVRTIEQDGLRYFLVPEYLASTYANPSERIANAGGYGYSQLTNTSPVFLTQGYHEGLMAQSPLGSLAAPRASLIQPVHPPDSVATAGLMTSPYHVPSLYPSVPYPSGPSIDPASGYASSVNWSDSVNVPQSQDDLFGLYA